MKMIYNQLFFTRRKYTASMHYVYIEFTQYCIMSSEDAAEIDDLERH